MLDFAVAVVVGAAFTGLVHAFVSDLITPLITAIAGKPDFSGLYFSLHRSRFNYGDLINSVVAFVTIAAVVYFLVVAPVNRLIAHLQRYQALTERLCPECLSEIPAEARRCKFCTAEVSKPRTPQKPRKKRIPPPGTMARKATRKPREPADSDKLAVHEQEN